MNELCAMKWLRLLLMHFAALLLVFSQADAQCISVFPYQQDFELDNGAWLSGGVNSDWTWGSPTKPLINAAASGQKCWIIGGLTNSFYSGGQKSWIESPCFDFSSLSAPYISFSIFWDTEKTFDGGNFQYSVDGGLNWINLGSASANGDCLNANWFNDGAVNNLSGLAFPAQGWSGNTQSTSGSCRGGGGQGAWVTASQCASQLSNASSVKFRFTFGSGTTCNNYDGIAIDNFIVSEAPYAISDFTFSCKGNNSVQVDALLDACSTAFTWDFGDPTSINNTATGASATHQYQDGGTYTITLSAAKGCNRLSVVQKEVEFTKFDLLINPVTCKDGNDGFAELNNITGLSPTIEWNNNPLLLNTSLPNLVVGTYSVEVASLDACPLAKNFDVGYGPNAFPVVDLGPDQRLCPGQSITLDAGQFSSYLWNTGEVTNMLSVNSVGDYNVLVYNDLNCKAYDTIAVLEGCGDNIWLPTSFTPNSDGLNDFYLAYGVAVENFKMQVFNRWGQVVFTSNSIYDGWDGIYNGSFSSIGVYTSKIEATLYDGTVLTLRSRFLLSR
jgi:gliding motility-associated-like protein